MKISWTNTPSVIVTLEAETDVEAEWLTNFFKLDCRKIAKDFPLRDEKWGKGGERRIAETIRKGVS